MPNFVCEKEDCLQTLWSHHHHTVEGTDYIIHGVDCHCVTYNRLPYPKENKVTVSHSDIHYSSIEGKCAISECTMGIVHHHHVIRHPDGAKEFEQGKLGRKCECVNSVTGEPMVVNTMGSVEEFTWSNEDDVNHPAHYTQYRGLEVIDLTEQMNFNRGNAVKYICRAGYKGGPDEDGVKDLQKAVWYLNREIDRIVSGEDEEDNFEQVAKLQRFFTNVDSIMTENANDRISAADVTTHIFNLLDEYRKK